jgi:hypothetical protein
LYSLSLAAMAQHKQMEQKAIVVEYKRKPLTRQVVIYFNVNAGVIEMVGGGTKFTMNPGLGFDARYCIVRTFSYEDSETGNVAIGPYSIHCAQFGGQPIGVFLGGAQQKTMTNSLAEIYIDSEAFGKNSLTLEFAIEGFGVVVSDMNDPPDGSCMMVLEFRSEL